MLRREPNKQYEVVRTISVFLDGPGVDVHCVEEVEEGQLPANAVENDLFTATRELVDARAKY